MKKTKPHPWEQPGHRFYTPGFPPGYIPTGLQPKGAGGTMSSKTGQAWRKSTVQKGRT